MVMQAKACRHEITVVIPTYNRCLLLKRAIHSVYQQTVTPREVIVVDDGSTDKTQVQLKSLFPQVIWKTQKNQGVSSARNRGIQESKSEWIALLDSDDEWHPQKLELQSKCIIDQPGILFFHTDEKWIRKGKKVTQPAYLNKKNERIFQKSLDRCIICPSSVLLHRSLFEEVGYFDQSLSVCEDYDLWLRILVCHEVEYLPKKLVTKYGGHSDQLSTKYWGMDRFRVRSLKKLVKNSALKKDQKVEILTTLIRKLELLIFGFNKHGKRSEAIRFQKEKSQFSQLLQDFPKPTPFIR